MDDGVKLAGEVHGSEDHAGGLRAPGGRTRASGLVGLALMVGLLAVLAVLLVVPGTAPATPAAPVVPARVGTVDHGFSAPGVRAPTGRKTEAAKLWFQDGTWWGVLFQPSRDAYTINRFDQARDRWVDTGTVLDDRNASQADVLWDGEHLYGVSGGTDPASDDSGPIIVRFSYDRAVGGYRMDRGFPVRIGSTGSEMFTLDQDDSGQLWVTWTAGQAVWITHSLADDRTWAEPVVLPVAEASDISPDDISAVVAYDEGVGIMWSDQSEGSMLWATAPAGAGSAGPWRVTAIVKATAMADDHMNLKALRDDPAGLVVAAIKTSRNDLPAADPSDPLILLLVLRRDGTWSRHVVSTVRQNETRPLLLVDEEHRQLFVMTSAPCCTGGTIYLRTSPLDEIRFDPAEREVVLRRGRTSRLNNAASTKSALDATSGMLVMASDDDVNWYMHAWRPLSGAPVPVPTAGPGGGSTDAGGPEPDGVVLIEGFEDPALERWTVATGTAGARVAVDAEAARSDAYGLSLAADATAGSFAWARVPVPGGGLPLGVDLDFSVEREGAASGNVPILRLLGPDGARLLTVYRQNGGVGRLWLRTPSLRESTLARVERSAWTHVALTVTTADGITAVASLRVDGQLVGQVTLPVDEARFATLQLGNDTAGQAFAISIDEVRIRR